MEIIKRGQIDRFARCEKCGTELRYEPEDLRWTHTEPNYYYIKCPICGEIIWIDSTRETDQMWNSIHKNN